MNINKRSKSVILILLSFVLLVSSFTVVAVPELKLTCPAKIVIAEGSVVCTLAFNSPQKISTFSGKLDIPSTLDKTSVIIVAKDSSQAKFYSTNNNIGISYQSPVTKTEFATVTFKAAGSGGDISLLSFQVNNTKTKSEGTIVIYSSPPAKVAVVVVTAPAGCTPKTVCDSGKVCGTQDNGCDGTVTCGTCASGKVCTNNQCVDSSGGSQTEFCNDSKKVVDKGKISTDSKQYCDSSYKLITCGKEKKERDEITVNTKKYVCDTGTFKECFNLLCPLTSELDVVKNVIDASKFGVDENKVGDDITKAVDVALNKPFYTLFSGDETDKEVYFKYNGKIFVVSVYNLNQYNGEATLDVQSYVDDTFIVIDEPIELLLTKDNKVIFNEKQAALNLAGDSAPEAYLGVYGYFQNDATKKLQLLVTVNPLLNLDKYSEGTLLLPTKSSQKFQLNGEQSVLLSKTKTGPILLIGGEEKTDLGADVPIEVLLDFGQKVNYQIVNSSLPIGAVKLSKGAGVLSTQYERFFTKDIKYDVSEVSSYQICKGEAATLNVVSVCDQTQKEKFSLSYETKVKEENGILYWYAQGNQSEVKKVQVFQLRDLTGLKNELGSPFTQNMVLGKRLALKVDGKYYVLSHPVMQYMELPLLQLTSVEDGSIYIAEGNQEEVWFNLPLAKQVNVKLNLGGVGNTVLSYDISAKTKVSKDVDLVNQLQTKVSTYGTTKLKVPDLGEMGIHGEDIKSLKDRMRIVYTQNNGLKDVELKYAIPQSVEIGDNYDVLLYYNQFTPGGEGGKFTKYADVYLLYDLNDDKTAKVHDFNDQNFAYPLVKGGKIAFLYDKKYYLLSYAKQWDKNKAIEFTLPDLLLSSLDGVTKYTSQSTPKGVVFEVGGKKIEIWYDSIKKLIYFKGATSAIYAVNSVDLDTEFSVKLPDSSLTQKNVMEVTFGSTTVGKYHNCDSPSYKGLKGTFLLCGLDKDESKSTPIALNEPKLVEIKNNPSILVWYRAKTGEQKDITLQKVYDLTAVGVSENNKFTDWVGLKESLQAQKYPVVKNMDNYYELMGNGELSTLGLKKVPTGETAKMQMQSTREGKQNGTIVIGNDLFFFQQGFEGEDIVLQMQKLSTKLLNQDMVNVTVGVEMVFVNDLSGDKYSVSVEKVGNTNKLVKVMVKEEGQNKPFASFKLANEASKKVVLPNGKVIVVEVLDVTKGIVGVSQ